jgi:microsomal dipeptidase-like Zn-dependent dipeptidase
VRARVAGLALAAVLVSAASASAATTPTRYSLQGGCYSLKSTSPGTAVAGDKLRFQATRLGSYLLFTADKRFLALGADGKVAPAAQPSPAADWRVEPAAGGAFTLSPASDRSKAFTATFTPADGCAVFPEAELNATGTPSKGALPFGRVGGFFDGHMHWMTYEYIGGKFHCGRPWSPYGIPAALPDCAEIEGPQGSASPIQNTLNFGAPTAPHDTVGWPTFKSWSNENVTYEGIYWRWMQRAWMSGLKLIVMPVNENRILCELMSNRVTDCNEMNTVRRALDDMDQLQDYVDAQAGGPGKGFFQIVRDPFEARRVINAGKMAVVLEIEVSELFGCKGWDTSTCDKALIDRELDEFYKRGVRSSLLLNKFDNPLAGVRFDSGPIGALINAGNKSSAGSFWSAETCRGELKDNEISGGAPQGDPTVTGALALFGLSSGALPTYPPAPHCNTRGLTDLGKYLEREMIDRRMIINPDHMSQKAVEQTITLAEARDYSGVISPHGWMDPGNWPRVWKLGGMAFPNAGSAKDYVKAWKEFRPRSNGKFELGWGYGADLGGLAKQGEPGPAGATAVTYPFKSYDGKVTFDRQKTGERTFDYAKDGVAHYGLYADWIDEVGKIGGRKVLDDMWNASEAYLQMWERANGVPGPRCRRADDGLTRKGLGAIRLRYTPERLLKRVGQPQQRDRAWSYCVRSPENKTANATAVFSPEGRIELVGANARGIKALGIGTGTPARNIPKRAVSFGGSMKLLTSRGATYLFGVSAGKVSFVALPSAKLLKSPKELLEYVALLRKARARQFGAFVPAATKAGRRSADGTPFVAREDGELLSKVCLL